MRPANDGPAMAVLPAAIKPSQQTEWTKIVLVILVGLLNFHVPHYLFEHTSEPGRAEYLLELILVANVIAALAAAAGIYRGQRWGSRLGIGVCLVSALLWLAQETVGLPGLPQQWLEPSRIVALLLEGIFVVTAWKKAFADCCAESGTRGTEA